MLVTLFAAALTVKVDLLGMIQQRYHAAPEVKSLTCHIETTSYRFVGQPGTQFSYDGDSYRVPESGVIELISTKANDYVVNGRALPLNLWPKDSFGTRTIPLPTSN